MKLHTLDHRLIHLQAKPELQGIARFFIELLMFGVKQARACLFAGLFFTAIFLIPNKGLWILPRYDSLLIIALIIQAWMIWTKLETVDEFKAICLFHIIGFLLELFKTSSSIKSWSYPDFAYTKFYNVPLFSGFMYAAVGSYIIQAWRLLDLKIKHHPPYWIATLIAVLIYINFFTHHYIGDYRWYLAISALVLYARTTVVFHRPRANNAFILGIYFNRFFYLAGRKYEYILWNLEISSSNGSLVYCSSWQMEFMVVISHNDFYHSGG